MIRNLLYTFISVIGGTFALQAQIYDNGPLFNSVGTGAGGANESVLYTTTFGMGTIGFGQQQASFNRIADDFTVDCSWTIDSIYFYGYQTNSTTTSTFTGYTLRIWDGVPDAVGSNVIWGDTTTNRLIRTVFSNVYRITETTVGSNARPIMQNTVNVGGFTLPAGTYWFDWAATGSLASGPWQPSVVPPGQAASGNGRQRIGNTWNNMVDGGTGTPPQGAPFKVFGTAITVTADAGADAALCFNTTAVLGGSPAGVSSVNSPLTYAWQGNGISDTTLSNPTIVVSDTLQFMLTVNDANGCVAMDTLTITSVPVIPVSLNVTETTFCEGESDVLIADQTSNLNWSSGDTTSTLTVDLAGIYSVTYIDSNGCSSSDTAMVNVWTLPALTVSDLTVCDGDQAELFGTGDNPIFWNDTIANGTLVDVTTQTMDYIASTVDTNGCVSVDTITVTLAALPIVTVPTDLTVCEGESVQLMGTSDFPVLWNDSIADGTTVNPLQTTSYVASVIDTNNCSGEATFTVTVNPVTAGTTTVTGMDSVIVNGVTYYEDGIFIQPLTNANGCDSILTVIVDLDFTGLNELSNNFNVAPNPMSDFLTVNNLATTSNQFTVTTIAGQVVLSFVTNGASTKVDVSSLTPGTYLLIDERTNQSLLLVKQ